MPTFLNNPFRIDIPKIAQIAAKEFQEFVNEESKKWEYDFDKQKGKMFGILVVQSNEHEYGYLGTVSGKLPGNEICKRFVPSVFDDSVNNSFLNKGMTELTGIRNQIKQSSIPAEISLLEEKSKQKSIALQHRLFEKYSFINRSGKSKNLLEIFDIASHGYPPSAAGECGAPKLLQYALERQLRPIAFAEFWWGKSTINKDKKHKAFYPACKDRCRPILEYMLEDMTLFESCNKAQK